jgi:membrane protease YdiL (CAAX protease family)
MFGSGSKIIKNRESKIYTRLKWIANTPVTKIIVGFAVCIIFMLSLKNLLINFSDEAAKTPSWQFLFRAAMNIGIYWLIFRFWEKRKISEISLKRLNLNGALSVIFGFFLISFVVLILYILGNYSNVSFAGAGILVLIIVELFAASVFEEVLLRGIVFRITEKSLNTIWALIISSVLFSILHMANSGFNLASFISLMLIGGVLGLIYSLTKNIWSVIFVHLGWNFAQAFYGLKISGRVFEGMADNELTGPLWLTGGEFGLENSYITIVLLAIVFAVLYRKHLVKI